MATELFSRFSSVLTSGQAPVIRDPRLLLDSDGQVQVYYAPFEYINPVAKIVLVGITPGPTQMYNANRIAREALLAGKSNEEAVKIAKEQGAFSGTVMRSNLAKQMNHWGIHDWLGIRSSEELFAGASQLIQTTSLIRYPTFVQNEDYRGTPDMTKNPLLRKYLLEHFSKEVGELKKALFVPLGPMVQKVVDFLVREGVIGDDRLIRGLLHPSPNCTYRIDYLIGSRSKPVPHATNPVPYDQGRATFRQQFLTV